MTEQELQKKIRQSGVEDKESVEYFIDLAKAYAADQVAAKDKKLSEIRKLCKAFLHDLPCSHNVAVIGDFLDAYSDAKIFDEFKKSVVSAKDAEINRLQIEVENLKSYQQSLECDNFHANAHADTFDAEITALKADNARLLRGIDAAYQSAHPVCQRILMIADGSQEAEDKWRASGILLEDACKGLLRLLAPSNQLDPSNNPLEEFPTECTCSHTYDGRLIKQCEACRVKPFSPSDVDGVGDAKMDENGLLPCPFCGSSATLRFQLHDIVDWVVDCDNCGASSCPIEMRESKELAKEDWNRRAGRGIGG